MRVRRPILFPRPILAEIVAEYQRVVMRAPDLPAVLIPESPVRVVPVLPAKEVRDFDRPQPEAKPFQEVLGVFLYQGPPHRQTLVVVRQRDEAVALVHLGFVHAPRRPLERVVEPTANATAARQDDRPIRVTGRSGKYYRAFSGGIGAAGPIALEGFVARHSRDESRRASERCCSSFCDV